MAFVTVDIDDEDSGGGDLAEFIARKVSPIMSGVPSLHVMDATGGMKEVLGGTEFETDLAGVVARVKGAPSGTAASNRASSKEAEANTHAADSSAKPEPYSLTMEQIASFQRDGHVELKSLVSSATLEGMREGCLATLNEQVKHDKHSWPPKGVDASKIGCHTKEFLRSSNNWPQNAAIKALATSPVLAQAAARLLGVKRVRLYTDTIYRKQACDKYTRFHRDLDGVPLNSAFGTLHIPLQALDVKGMSPLIFLTGSHRESRAEAASNATGVRHKHFWEKGGKLSPANVLKHYPRDKVTTDPYQSLPSCQ